MHALLASLPLPEGGAVKVSHEWVVAADWAVLFTLATLLFLLSSFAIWAWLIWRRTTQPEPHVKLLMELEEEETAAAESAARTASAQPEPESDAPWEQSADWWKKADS
jgi:hypothetical protein